ncbi:phosphopantetheine-binding protein [Streptomyces sp. HSW2009]|uniref:phosphopantetheine-binding protein n=1 Tax=Streptomyces sp. HSW2009 TaxID=3142890 RepID=UPI0032EC5490
MSDKTHADLLPETVEKQILDWATDLLEEQVSNDDNFLDLGGHSALALDLNGRIKESYGVDLDLQLLFENSLGDVAADVARRAETPAN